MLPSTLEEAYDAVSRLSEAFHEHRHAYIANSYSEAQARQDFIDKLLVALGWDVHHDYQKNPFEQEVRVERNVNVGHSQKRADYAVFVGPNFRDVRFYVEAKKPSTVLDAADHYFQVIRYGWNSHTPIAFLTDFQGLRVLDCRYKPDISTALEHCVLKLHYLEYKDSEKFAKLYYLLSREAVTNGALERFALSLPKKRGPAVQTALFRGGYQSIDEAFLADLDDNRDTLARSLKITNPHLDGPSLTEITQRILDRLVFSRFLEDKLIETDDSVAKLGSKGSVWGDFKSQTKRLDQRYNGVVYKPHPLIDSEKLKVDDEMFANICEELADINSPYNFDLIPIYILGNIYERFLGKVITTTDKRAKIEDKPEVRKAGGVYYTPEYIVRYIVENTVRKLIRGKKPVEIAKMRFADVACGSGSFLLGIFDALLDYHRDWYNANPKSIKTGDCWQDNSGAYHLTLAKRRDILLNNIYGVDVDPQAVEVAQLSLYLKLLEEETTATSAGFQREFHVALLPALDDNIVCGNSIIEPRMLTQSLFDDDLERTINPLSFRDAFPKAHASGGFDAIIGNPPYVNAWELFANQPAVRELLNNIEDYVLADRHWDLYILFLERALGLIKGGGMVSYIIPFSFGIQKYGQKAREHILKACTIESIADLRTIRVFGKVPVITIIPVISKEKPAAKDQIDIRRPVLNENGSVDSISTHHVVPQGALLKQHESMLRLDLDKTSLSIIRRMEPKSINLGELCYVNYGAQMSSKVKGRFGKDYVIRSKKESPTCKPLVSGKELFRYEIRSSGRFVEYALAPKMYGPRWPEFFEQPKLMIRDITGTHRIEATLDLDGYYCDHTILCAQRMADVSAWKEFTKPQIDVSQKYDLAFLAAVVCSRLNSAFYYLVLTGEGVRTGGGFHTYPETIRQFNVPTLDFTDSSDKEFHDALSQFGKQAIEARKKYLLAKTGKDQNYYLRRFEHADREIDAGLYTFYGLTADEKVRVEEVSA